MELRTNGVAEKVYFVKSAATAATIAATIAAAIVVCMAAALAVQAVFV
jgi:hypothetical protein